jgi:hypothetical protein
VSVADRRSHRAAARLLASYPPAWRSRYGEEFVELLIADFEDRPRSWRRTADVLASGALARLRTAGLAKSVLDPAERIRTSLAALGCAVAVFLTVGVAMWSQVVIGWRWEPPAGPAVAVGMVAMSAATLVIGTLAVLAAIPVMQALVRAAVERRAVALVRPSLLVTVGSAVLIAGSRHFATRWPGTGGHPWAYHRLVPPGMAAFCWAATRGVTSYWVHPDALGRFSIGEVAWMAVSLMATLGLVVGVAKTVRRLELTPRALRFEANLAEAAVVAMVAFVGGASGWVVAGGAPGPTGIYRVGAIDVVGLPVMAVALLAAYQAVAQGRSAGLALTGAPRH